MERELVGLLGAGLTSAATGYGIAVPVGAIDRGYTLVDVLSRECGPRIGAALNTLVQNLWLEWQRTGLDRDTTALHAGALPAIIELNRPLPEAFAVARNSTECGRQLAAEVLERARRSGDIQRAGLDEGIAYALLERLYHAIFAEQAGLPEMMAAVDLYLQTNLWQQDLAPPPPPAQPPRAAEPPSPAIATVRKVEPPKLLPPLAERARAAVRAGIDTLGMKVAEPDVLAAELYQRLAQLIDRTDGLAQRAPDASPQLINAARHLADGELSEAERSLASGQEALIQRASSDLSLARQLMNCAAELLAIRAELEEIRLDMRKAARHYRAAIRCLTSADGDLAWRYLALQAHALTRLDRLQRDDAILAEAARTWSEALAIDPHLIGATDWAHGQSKLAELHFELGHRSGNPQEFLEAARHAAEAIAALRSLGAGDEISDICFTHAQSLWFAAERIGDPGLLDAAAQAFHDALAFITREQLPIRWVTAQSLLGQALLRLATLRAEPKLLSAATGHLRAAVQFASTCNVAFDTLATEAALGRALLGEYTAGGQPLLLDLAATAFRRAIKGATASGQSETKAALQHELGMTLWAMAERAHDNGGLATAIEALEASIATYEGIGSTTAAAAVRMDLGKLIAAVPGKAGAAGINSAGQYS